MFMRVTQYQRQELAQQKFNKVATSIVTLVMLAVCVYLIR